MARQPCGPAVSVPSTGAFSLLRENFSHAPSLDMKPASLSMLEQLMTAQAQECVFESLSLPAPVAPDDFPAQLRLAQEAAQVAAEYQLVHQTMAQLPVRDYVPFPWTSLVRVKAEYFQALAHYHTAMALCDGPSAAEVAFPGLQQGFRGLPTASEPQDTLPHRREEHRKLGEAALGGRPTPPSLLESPHLGYRHWQVGSPSCLLHAHCLLGDTEQGPSSAGSFWAGGAQVGSHFFLAQPADTEDEPSPALLPHPGARGAGALPGRAKWAVGWGPRSL